MILTSLNPRVFPALNKDERGLAWYGLSHQDDRYLVPRERFYYRSTLLRLARPSRRVPSQLKGALEIISNSPPQISSQKNPELGRFELAN